MVRTGGAGSSGDWINTRTGGKVRRGMLGFRTGAGPGGGAGRINWLGERVRDRARQRRQRRAFDPGWGRWPLDRRFGNASPDGRRSRSEVEAMRLPNDCVFGDRQAPSYFGSGMALLPQVAQDLDRLIVPHHILVPSAMLTTKYSSRRPRGQQRWNRVKPEKAVDNLAEDAEPGGTRMKIALWRARGLGQAGAPAAMAPYRKRSMPDGDQGGSGVAGNGMEVRAGIEPASADLQSDASPLCHRTPDDAEVPTTGETLRPAAPSAT